MHYVADQGFSLRRPTKILHTHGPDHVEAYKDRHRPASQRVVDVQQAVGKLHRDNTTVANFTPCFLSLDHATPELRDMSRVQPVSFHHRETVYPADDYDQKSAWVYIARRRQQCRLRIQHTELILAPILDDVHRLTILMSRCDT